ncbi:MAG: hypothetical protein Q8K75_04785 [Chlamydiales bacterium]|nr:hypothetical protein [Chlamydiales bacterium]
MSRQKAPGSLRVSDSTYFFVEFHVLPENFSDVVGVVGNAFVDSFHDAVLLP